MKKEHHNIVIIGAGPAGASASLFLSKAGISHVLIDKAVFPRDKICGDALSGKVVSQLKKLDPEYRQLLSELKSEFLDCHGIRFVSPKRLALDVPFKPDTSKDPYSPGFISKRIDFDQFLVDRLNRSTCDFRQGTELKAISKEPDHISLVVKDNDGEYNIEAKLVIAADGAHSLAAKTLAGHRMEPKHHSAGIRAYYKNVKGMLPQNYIELHFLKELLPGYFWIFPLPGGYVNVGVGMLTASVSKDRINLKEKMLSIINTHPDFKDRFEGAEMEGKIMGWGLPLGSRKRNLSGDHFMLTGDAASIIDPFTGEGIGNAMISGQYAAEMAKKALESNNFSHSFLEAYDKKVYTVMGDELRLSYTMQKLLRFPWLFDFVVKKANKNKTLKEAISSMFDNVDLRAKFKDPFFYLKILFG